MSTCTHPGAGFVCVCICADGYYSNYIDLAEIGDFDEATARAFLSRELGVASVSDEDWSMVYDVSRYNTEFV